MNHLVKLILVCILFGTTQKLNAASLNSAFFSDSTTREYFLNHIRNALDQRDNSKSEVYLDSARVYCAATDGSISNFYFEILRLSAWFEVLKKRYQLAHQYMDSSIEVTKQLYGVDNRRVGESYVEKGLLFIGSGEMDSSLHYQELGYHIMMEGNPKFTQNIEATVVNLSLVYRGLGNYAEAIKILNEGLQLCITTYGEDHARTAFMYIRNGVNFNNVNKFESAISMFEHAAQINQKLFNKNNEDIAICYTNIGVSYMNLQDYSKAIEYTKKALEIRKILYGEENIRLANGYNNLGEIFFIQKQYELSIDYYLKTYHLRKTFLQPYDMALRKVLLNIGLVYKAKNELDTALSYMDKALQINLMNLAIYKDQLPSTYLNIAAVLKLKGDYESAMKLVDSGLVILNYKEVNDLAICGHKEALYSLLFLKAELFNSFYLKRGEIENLSIAADLYSQARIALQYFEKYAESDQTINLNSSMHDINAGAILNNGQLYIITKDKKIIERNFLLSEESKSKLLYEAVISSKATKFANIPDSALNRIATLKSEINDLAKNIDLKANKVGAIIDSSIAQSRKVLVSKRLVLDKFVEKIEIEFPAYLKLKNSNKALDVPFIQSNLLFQDQTILEYFMTENVVHIFLISKDTFTEIPIPINKLSGLSDLIYRYTSSFTKNSNFNILNKVDAANFVTLSDSLYNILIKPVEHLLSDEVIIIPDEDLNYLPFETLLSERPTVSTRFYQHKYFGAEHKISYSFSIKLLDEAMYQNNSSGSANLIAMAPFFSTSKESMISNEDDIKMRDTLINLPASGKEVKSIASFFNGHTYTGTNAIKEIFLNEAPAYDIIHLSTHANANGKLGEYGWLAFADTANDQNFEKLYVRDIYNMQLKAKLVTLSACESGIGNLKSGEGLISLARSFTYAGASSLVTSLWKVEDKSAQEIMVSFYHYLKLGLPKNKALWEAKLDFRKSHRNDMYAHPFYWAGFVLHGDPSKL